MKILFLAPYSIPVNNPEAICNAKLIKAFTDANHELYVISKNNNHAYTPDEDSTIFVDRVKYLRIIYLKNVINFKTIVGHIKVLLKTGIVYKGAHWAYYAIRESEELIKANQIDLIMSRTPSSEIAAQYLSKKYGIPWIANWNDPYPDSRYPKPYGDGPNGKISFLQKKLFKRISTLALVHTFPSARLASYMSQYLDFSKVVIIPHVCMDDFFEHTAKGRGKYLRVIHSGNIAYPRSPEKLFRALRLFKDAHSMTHFEIAFIGKQDQAFKKTIEEYGLEENISVLPPSSYIANLQLMENFDLALLVEAEMQEGIYLPTKVGDYMQSQLPIWSLSPNNGIMNDLFSDGKIDFFSDNSSVDAIYKSFEEIMNVYVSNGKSLPCRPIIYEYKKETILRQYEAIFKSLS